MDREILFRGKRIDNGEWLEGFYYSMAETTYVFEEDYKKFPVPIHHYIMVERMTDWGLPNRMCQAEVDPKTVCQYTGLTDKNGKKIFEGDIVNCHEKRGAAFWHCEVVWNEVWARFDVIAMDCAFPMCLYYAASDISINGLDYEVIDNIFDEPKCDECKCHNCFSRSECCPQCEGVILGCEGYSETDIYKPDFSEGGAE